MSLDGVLSSLSLSAKNLSTDRLLEILSLPIELAELGQWIRFKETEYARNLIQRTESYEVLCLCWKPGQKSEPHDHWRSQAAFKVIGGAATETIFENRHDHLRVSGTRIYRENDAGAEPASLIHEFGNPESSLESLVSLHVYSPPLRDQSLGTLYRLPIADAEVGGQEAGRENRGGFRAKD